MRTRGAASRAASSARVPGVDVGVGVGSIGRGGRFAAWQAGRECSNGARRGETGACRRAMRGSAAWMASGRGLSTAGSQGPAMSCNRRGLGSAEYRLLGGSGAQGRS